METWRPELEKAIERRIDSAIGKPSWFKRVGAWMARRDCGGRVSPLIFYHLMPAGLVAVMSLLAGREVAAAWFGVFCLGMVLMSAGRVQWTLFGESLEASTWANFPSSDGQVFDFRWVRFTREFRDRFWGALLAGWVLLDFSTSIALCLWIPVFAVLHWLAMGSLTVLFAAYAPPFRSWLLGLGLIMSAGMLLANWNGDWQWRVETIIGYVNTFCPTAWSIQFLLWIGDVSAAGIWALSPIVSLLILHKPLLNVLRKRYRYDEPEPAEKERGLWDEISPAGQGVLPEIVEEKLSATEMRGSWVYRIHFGFIERMVDRWLTPREQLLLEAFGSTPLGFTAGWRNGWYLLFAAMVPMYLVDYRSGLPVAIAFLLPFLLVPFTFSGHAMTAKASSFSRRGSGPMLMSGFPVALNELLRLAWKGCIVRTAFGLPHLIVFAVFAALVMDGVFAGPGRSWDWHLAATLAGLESALEFAVMIIVVFPFFWMSSYACFYSGKQRATVFSFLDVIVLVPIAMVVMVLALLVIFSHHLAISIGGLAGMAVLMWIGRMYLRWRHHRSDLIGMVIE